MEVAVAASKTRIVEMEKKGFMMTVTTPENEMLYVKDTVAVNTYENEKKELKEYEEELKNSGGCPGEYDEGGEVGGV